MCLVEVGTRPPKPKRYVVNIGFDETNSHIGITRLPPYFGGIRFNFLVFCLCSDNMQGHCQICLSSENFLCAKCLICVYCHAAFPGLPLLCPPDELPLELNLHEQGEQPCGGLCSVPGQDHRAVPPWIAHAADEQPAGASRSISQDSNDAEFGGASSIEVFTEEDHSAADALSEWSDTGEVVDADPEQPLTTLGDSDSSSEDETATENFVAAEIVAEAEAHVAEARRWAEGHDCISHTQSSWLLGRPSARGGGQLCNGGGRPWRRGRAHS